MTYRDLLDSHKGLDSLLDKKMPYPKKIELYDMMQKISDRLKGFDRERSRILKEYKDGDIFREGKTEESMLNDFDELLSQEVVDLTPVELCEKDFKDESPTLREMLLCKVVKWI